MRRNCFLSQENYSEGLFEKYKIMDSKNFMIPMKVKWMILESAEVMVGEQYGIQNLIGNLLYIANETRLYISLLLLFKLL